MEVRRTPKGRGVFATRNYKAGDIVQIAPVIIYPLSDLSEDALLGYYAFEWRNGYGALALGTASLYNHSDDANLDHWPNKKDATMTFQACRPIQKGEEMTISYTGGEDSSGLVFLDPKRAKIARGGR